MDKKVSLSVRGLLLTGLAGLALLAAYLVGAGGGSPAHADTTPGGTRTITVVGVGHVSVVPDQLGFQLSVSVLRPDLVQAMDDASSAMQSVVDTLKSSGVQDKDVQTTNVSMYPEYDHPKGQPQTLRGYRVEQSVSVTVEDLTRASDIVNTALQAGGSGVRLDGLQLQVADPDGAMSPARSDAMKQARAKAEEYAADAGGRLGSIVRISETADQPVREDMSYAAAGSAADVAPIPIQPGQQDLTATVTVVYELG